MQEQSWNTAEKTPRFVLLSRYNSSQVVWSCSKSLEHVQNHMSFHEFGLTSCQEVLYDLHRSFPR